VLTAIYLYVRWRRGRGEPAADAAG
jgi:hypothetical protein